MTLKSSFVTINRILYDVILHPYDPVENVFKINFNIIEKIRLLAYIIVLDWF